MCHVRRRRWPLALPTFQPSRISRWQALAHPREGQRPAQTVFPRCCLEVVLQTSRLMCVCACVSCLWPMSGMLFALPALRGKHPMYYQHLRLNIHDIEEMGALAPYTSTVPPQGIWCVLLMCSANVSLGRLQSFRSVWQCQYGGELTCHSTATKRCKSHWVAMDP